MRLTRDLVRLLQERTGDGYVFRTDLRLRPDPALDAARDLGRARRSTTTRASGQNWERAALIKARPVAGDLAAGDDFLRRAAALHLAQVPRLRGHRRHPLDQAPDPRASAATARSRSSGHNIKLGRGGIREIEFFVQTQQLICGGRDAASCAVATRCAALARWPRAGWIDAAAPRRARRRLPLPAHGRAPPADGRRRADPYAAGGPRQGSRARRASAASPDRDAFADSADRPAAHGRGPLCRAVRGAAPSLDAAPAQPGLHRRSTTTPRRSRRWRGMGFTRAARRSSAMVRGWHHGRYRAMRSERARELLTECAGAAATLAPTADPDAAFVRFDRFLAELPAGVQLFSLLQRQPGPARAARRHHGTAPRLAEHPEHAAGAARRRARRRASSAALPDARPSSTPMLAARAGEARATSRTCSTLRGAGQRAAVPDRRALLRRHDRRRRRPAPRSPTSPTSALARAACRGASADFAARTARCRAAAGGRRDGQARRPRDDGASDLDLILIYDYDPRQSRNRDGADAARRRAILRAADASA